MEKQNNTIKRSFGAIYVAMGRPYLAMTLLSIKTLKSVSPSMPVTVITNVELLVDNIDFLSEGLDTIIFIDLDTKENRNIKSRLHEYSSYQKAVFLDSDTLIMKDLSVGEFLLDHFDVAMRVNPYPQERKGKGDVPILGGELVSNLPHWNSGVILFKKSEAVDHFFSKWNKSYNRIGVEYDQVSLVEAVFKSNVRFLGLEKRWNDTDPFLNRKKWLKRVRVFHYASNISNDLMHQIIAMDSLIPDEGTGEKNNETAEFISRKRRSKRKELGLLKYSVIKIFWQFSTPVKLHANLR
ncbi:hypothetical protein [Halomonas sp. M4R1S46]|uniref:hypothetical protein n=1 Tax=Halomonas sp. M4R1S46 TaxID=2982692 RepID=UPI0021E3C45E|nr:hypothetical protein [Halomonas sp. M4R1S46]UYG06235.1 hypothetical protein OCT48_11370 [Halomonas sp. M4R1S46]